MRYILFDLDGTVTDPKEGITKSVAYALSKFGIDVENLDDLCKFIGPPLGNSFEEFYGFTGSKNQQAIDEYRVYYGDKGIFECKLYEGIKELLEHLYNQGKKVILATSKPDIFANQLLEHFGVSKYFDFVAGSDIDGGRATKAEVIRHALDHYDDININDVVMVGDTKYDLIGASECNIPCIFVLYGYGNIEDIGNDKPFGVVKSVNELQKFLDSI